MRLSRSLARHLLQGWVYHGPMNESSMFKGVQWNSEKRKWHSYYRLYKG